MLRKLTVQNIISACDHIVKLYDNSCSSMPPGKEGLDRKKEFLSFISTLNDKTADEAIINIYDFYSKRATSMFFFKSSSRLLDFIQNQLMLMFIFDTKKIELHCHYRGAEWVNINMQSIRWNEVCNSVNKLRKKEEVIERKKIRIAAIGFAQVCRGHSIFLPKEIGVKIAALVTNKIPVEEAEKIALKNFCKPS